MTAVLGGEIQLIFEGLGSAAAHIRSGSIRALAVALPKRSPGFTQIPTMAQAGMPGFESLSRYGLWAPGMPPEIIDRLQAEVSRALSSPELASTRQSQGGESAERFARFVHAKTGKWGKVARAPDHRRLTTRKAPDPFGPAKALLASRALHDVNHFCACWKVRLTAVNGRCVTGDTILVTNKMCLLPRPANLHGPR